MCTVGSGKTFTIEGAGQGEAQGIIPRAARMIFECESMPALLEAGADAWQQKVQAFGTVALGTVHTM